MRLNPKITGNTLCAHALETGGRVTPLVFDLPKEDGVAIMNPSIINLDGKLIVNLRCTNYTLWHSYTGRWPHWWSPLQYLNPLHQQKLITVNYLGLLDPGTLILEWPKKIDMRLDTEPKWDFWGLEDARLVSWDGRLYIVGVRRDTTDNGQGRMEMSEIDFNGGEPHEVSRHRIPAPNGDGSYCEKNWMPVLDRPYHFVKWTTPTEVARYFPETGTTESVLVEPKGQFREVRGGSQVLSYKDKYIAIGHTVVRRDPRAGFKDAGYRNCLMIWDSDFALEHISDDFAFIRDGIEFCCGMCECGDDFLITFGEEDNAAYVVRIRKDELIVED